jgi:hypothetical protein
MPKTWNWHLYDVPDDRLFILALHDLFPQDSFLLVDFVSLPDFLAREMTNRGFPLPENCTLVSEVEKTGVAHGCTLGFHLTGPGIRLICGSEKRWVRDVRFYVEHIFVKREKTYLMTGYDFGTDDGFMVTHAIPADKIKQFCSRVSCKYEKVREPVFELACYGEQEEENWDDWEVSNLPRPRHYLKHLRMLLPDGACIQIYAAGGIPAALRNYMAGREQCENLARWVADGQECPWDDLSIPATPENLRGLSEVELSDEQWNDLFILAHKDGVLLLKVRGRDSIYLVIDTPEEAVREFSEIVGGRYARVDDGELGIGKSWGL